MLHKVAERMYIAFTSTGNRFHDVIIFFLFLCLIAIVGSYLFPEKKNQENNALQDPRKTIRKYDKRE